MGALQPVAQAASHSQKGLPTLTSTELDESDKAAQIGNGVAFALSELRPCWPGKLPKQSLPRDSEHRAHARLRQPRCLAGQVDDACRDASGNDLGVLRRSQVEHRLEDVVSSASCGCVPLETGSVIWFVGLCRHAGILSRCTKWYMCMYQTVQPC